MMKNVHRVLCKVPVILVRLERTLNFIDRFSNNSQISDFIKIPPVGARLFMRTDGRTKGQRNRRTDMTKLVFAFRNFANAPKNYVYVCSQYCGGLVHSQPANMTHSSLRLPLKREDTCLLVHKDVNDNESSQ
jgi:hypothetical protein